MRPATSAVLCSALVLAGCAAPRAAIPPLTVTTAAPAATTPVLVFVEDDYPRALAQAVAQGKPLFVDAWAPWCHTCLSMRSYVFTDEALRPLADRFVWLAIDTENPKNAAFVERFPLSAWPTLWVIDPKKDKTVLKWAGSATAPELASLLTDAASSGDVAVTSRDAPAEAALIHGEEATAAGDHGRAIASYRAALQAAPPRWARRGRADEALINELYAEKDDAACATLAADEMAKIPPGTSLANVGLLGLLCARRAPAGSASHALAPRLARAVEQIALDPGVPILDDDRSGLFDEVVDDRNADHDPEGAKSLATSWAAMLDARAASATTPAARAVFDAHRLLAYVALGDPARALPMLEQSEKDFPDDYNPPARIARVDLGLKRYDDGLAAITRALAKGYGPRKVKLFLLEADLLKAKGPRTGEPDPVAQVLEETRRFIATLPKAEERRALELVENWQHATHP